MVGATLEAEKYTKSVLTNKALTNYKYQSNGYVLPDNVMVQTTNNPVETRIQFARYDNSGNLVEQLKSTDVRHVYIWDYKSTYPVAEVVNGDSANIAYTSFEADGSGNWSIGSATRDTVSTAVTGFKSYILSNGSITKSGLSSSRFYRLSYWTKNAAAYAITGTTSGYPVQGKTINGWTYFEHRINGQTSVSLSGSGNIDELRLYPDSAQMTTYSYLPLVGMSSQCDVNNRITYFQYDGFNRLYVVRDQDRNALKKYCYGYAGQQIACQQFTNSMQTQPFQKACSPGYTGTWVTDTVQANTYVSLFSQGDADQMALNDIKANGQNNANAKGSCIINPVSITSVNNAGVSGFTATFTNTSTLVQTVFNIPAAGGTLGTLNPGTYNVTIAKSGNTIQYIFTVCTTTHAAAISSTFNNMAINSTCSTVQIDTVN